MVCRGPRKREERHRADTSALKPGLASSGGQLLIVLKTAVGVAPAPILGKNPLILRSLQ